MQECPGGSHRWAEKNSRSWCSQASRTARCAPAILAGNCAGVCKLAGLSLHPHHQSQVLAIPAHQIRQCQAAYPLQLICSAGPQVRKDEIDLLYNLLDINRDGLLELKEVVKSQQRLVKPMDTPMDSVARAA